MSTLDSSDSKRVLYLEQIDIETTGKMGLRFRLQKDNNNVEIQRKEKTPSWNPSRPLELVDVSRITIHARSKFIPWGGFASVAQIDGKQAMEAFWDSKESVSCAATLDRRPATITFHFRPSHTSETIRATLQALQTAMKDYKSLMQESTEQRIDAVVKFGVVLAEMTPFTKLAFGLTKCTFDLLKEQRKYDDNVSDLASGIDGLLPFAERALEGVLYEEELLDEVVRKLYELIGETAMFAIGYTKRGPAERALRATISQSDHEKIKALQRDFGTMKADFDRALDVATLTLARRSEETNLLKRLKPVEEANYDEDRSCMKGTRTTVLNDIIAWASKPSDIKTQSNRPNSNVFWLYGMPGLGKTSVANSLCDRLRNSGNLGGSFICKYDNSDLREPKRVLSTLIAKLVRMWGPFRKLVARVLLDEPQINPQSAHGELLLKPLQMLTKHPPHPLVLVIDALDECGQPSTRGPLLTCLIKASSLVPWLKIVLTSRPERDITSFFDRHHVTSRDLATDDLAREDIRLFTKYHMALVASQRNLPSDWPNRERVDAIVEHSDGLFIYVETLYRLVDVPEPERLLVQVLGGESQEAHTALHHLYSTVLTSRISQPTPALHSILRAITAVSAHRPLCDNTLAELIGLELPVVRSWVDELGSLLYRDVSGKGAIRVRHLSILEYLVGSTCPPEVRVEQNLANSELASCCFRTMEDQLKFNICDLETSYSFNVDIPYLSDRVEQSISDTLQYSCVHWSDHLCFDPDPVSAEITRLLDNFFAGAQPLYWLEVLSLMARVPVAILALRLMEARFKKFEDRHQRLVEDVLRFVLAFFTPISTSTPHIYISALPFMPTDSILWKRASISFPGILSVCNGRMKSWPAPSGIWHGHTDYVRSLAYSLDGRNVVSGSDDNTLRLWDAQTGAAVGEPLRGHTGSVWSVAYSPDGLNITSGSDDNTIRIWDAQTGAAVGESLKGHTGSVWSVTYAPDSATVASGSSDNTVRIWDAQTGEALGEPLMGHSNHVWSVTYSPDGRNIASGSEDKTIRVWDAQKRVATCGPLRGHASAVRIVTYSPDGRSIVSGSNDDVILVWDVEAWVPVGKPITGNAHCVRSVSYLVDGWNSVGGPNENTIRMWQAQMGSGVFEALTGHAHYVRSVAYSPDGRNIVSGSHDSKIQIWDVQLGKAAGNPITEHNGAVCSVAYSPDGRTIASGSDDNTVRIWHAQTGAAAGEPLIGHTRSIWCLAYSPDGRSIASGSKDKTIRIWDARTGAAIVKPLRGHANYVCSVAYSPNGRNIVSGSEDTTIRIWDAQTGESVGEPLTGHTNYIWSVSYSPNGEHVVSCSTDGTIRIWDVQTRALVGKPLMGHTSAVSGVAYSPDGSKLVSGSDDNTVRIWDVRTGVPILEPLKGHAHCVRSVAYSPDGRHVVSGSKDNTIRIWDAQTGAQVGEPLTRLAHYVRGVAYSPDGRNVVVGSSDKTIRIRDAQTGEPLGEPQIGHTAEVWSAAYSPDGRIVVSGSADNTIRLWDVQTGAAVGQPLTGHAKLVLTVLYSPDGRKILSGCSDGKIRVWDAQAGKEIGDPLTGHTGYVWCLAYSPDGQTLISGSEDKTIRIWDAQTGAAKGEPLIGHTGEVWSVTYSPDGRNIISGSEDSTIRFWDARTGVPVGKPLTRHDDRVRSIACSPDGRNIISGSTDTMIRIWDAQARVVVGEPLAGHTNYIHSVGYSPDGQNFVSCCSDGTVRIWDAKTGASVGGPLAGHTDRVRSVVYSPDGRSFVSASDDHTVRIWGAKRLEDGGQVAVPDFSNLSNDHFPLTALSGHPLPKQLLDSSGWVSGPDGVFFWVPEDFRHGLICPAITTFPSTGRQRSVRIDFTHLQHGTSWVNVRGMNKGGTSRH